MEIVTSIHSNNRALYNKEQEELLSRAFNTVQSKVLFSDDSSGNNSISIEESGNCSNGRHVVKKKSLLVAKGVLDPSLLEIEMS